MEEKDDYDDDAHKIKQFKVILLGNGATGKTSIASRFTSETFATSYKQTIGLDFFIKRLVLPGNMEVTLQLWDIGGQTIGGKMINNYIYNAHAVILCYDITNNDSFQDLEDWYRLVKKSFNIGPENQKRKDAGDEVQQQPIVALMANKIDLEHIRAVSKKAVKQFAVENDFVTFGVSAKSGDNVNVSFHQLAASLAGVVLPVSEIESRTAVVKATIMNHLQHDEDVQSGEVPDYTREQKKCVIS